MADTVTVVFVGLLALYLVGELILAKLRGGTGNKDAHRAGSRVAEGDGNEEKPHRQQVAVSKKAIRTAGKGKKDRRYAAVPLAEAEQHNSQAVGGLTERQPGSCLALPVPDERWLDAPEANSEAGASFAAVI